MRASEPSDAGERQDLRELRIEKAPRVGRLAPLMSSGKDDWQTPPELFAALDAEFHFTLDAAATSENALCQLYLGPDHGPEYRDALTTDWWIGRPREAAYCNPPYSRGLQAKFIAKAASEAQKGCNGFLTVVMLLPARTDTKAFHRYIWDAEKHQPRPGVEVRFLPGRLKFSGAKDAAPFPSMVVVFRGDSSASVGKVCRELEQRLPKEDA